MSELCGLVGLKLIYRTSRRHKLRITSTYLDLEAPCRWLRGNHHGHSTVSDGQVEPLQIVRAYEAEGYHYFALSEHDRLLRAELLQPHTSMCILQAIEVTSCYNHTLMYLGADRELPAKELPPREIMQRAHSAGGLFVFDHPNWRPWPNYATNEQLESIEGMLGMEIYCGVIERLPGTAKATDRWDWLLSKGWRVFGHGTDDQHRPDDYFIAWNCVQWPQDEKPSPAGIVAALAAGRFYASTGVTISKAGAGDGSYVTVESDADEVHWIIRDGIIVKKVKGGEGLLTLEEFTRLPATSRAGPNNAIYVRAECLGHGNAAAWTQPFWIAD